MREEMKRILIIFAHPALQKSRVNKQLIRDLDNMEGVTFHDIYQSYPDMDIDIPREQQLLTEHEVIIFHHPLFWYSTPAILKEWQDLVLVHNWAYGGRGDTLKDKLFLNVITTGGQVEAYREQGYNRFTVRQFLAPMEQTASLCKMIYLPPYVVHGTHSITEQDVENHRENYKKIIALLQNDKVETAKLRKLNYLNDYLK
jgi:glutathione-regulated potassium-efflux system ancillary protein KefG